MYESTMFYLLPGEIGSSNHEFEINELEEQLNLNDQHSCININDFSDTNKSSKFTFVKISTILIELKQINGCFITQIDTTSKVIYNNIQCFSVA